MVELKSLAHERKVAWLYGLALFALLMFLTGREPPWGDARIMYDVAGSITHGKVSIGIAWPPMSHAGADGAIYSQYALLPSLAHLPGIWLRNAMEPTAIHRVITSHVAPAFGAALTVVMFLLAAQTFYSRRASRWAAAMVAFGSLLFVYARYPMSEALQAGVVMGMLRSAIVLHGKPGRTNGIWFGAWCGIVVNTKSVLLLSVLALVLALAWLLRHDRPALRQSVVGLFIGALPFVILFGWYNMVRWGAPWSTGYGETLGMMNEHPLSGLWGLVVSPGKGILWFSPAIIVAVIGVYRLVAQRNALGLLIVATVVPPVLFYSRFLSWSGDYAWGPRYLVFAMAPMYLGIAHVLHASTMDTVTRVAGWCVRGVFALSVAVQLLGASVFWDHWIRISRKANIEWLGAPNRSGAAIAEAGRGHCDSCFEDMHGHQWLPPLSPLYGQLWLVRSLITAAPWQQAQANAPWRRYTALDIASPAPEFAQIRFDWWFLATGWSTALRWSLLWLVLAAGGLWRGRRYERQAAAG